MLKLYLLDTETIYENENETCFVFVTYCCSLVVYENENEYCVSPINQSSSPRLYSRDNARVVEMWRFFLWLVSGSLHLVPPSLTCKGSESVTSN
jgi:hypothetical protein